VCSKHKRGQKGVQDFGGKPKGKRPFGKSRRRWEDGIRMYLRETGWGVVVMVVECIHLAMYRDQWWALVNVVMNLQLLPPQR
jgi:hypothetical protein